MKKISIVTPCYNEVGNVENMYNAVSDVMSKLTQYEYEHIFIDNCSNDGTQEILYKIAQKDKNVKIIFNARNFGPNRSGAYGVYQATGDAIIGMACDFQDPPELIPQFIKKWEEGYKVVWGKKESSQESRVMFKIRTLYYKIIAAFSDVKQYKHTTGFGLYDKYVVEMLIASDEPSPNFRNMIAEFGYEIGFIEYDQPKRASGKSHYNFWSYLDTAIEALINTSHLPIRFSIYAGAGLGAFGVIGGLIFLILSAIYGNQLLVMTAIILAAICIVGAVQLVFIGIVGEYVYETLRRTKKRQLIVERERINF
ncbi:MAG: glycosyltransferase family 2 protein [Oscillospiraceae bacterium]